MSTTAILTLRGHTNNINCVVFSPDGRRIASSSDDNTLIIWDAMTGKAIGSPLRHKTDVYGVAFSPDNKRIVSGSEDGTLQIWDVVTGRALGSPLKGHTYWVRCVAFSPDGQRIASGSDDKTVRLWDGETGEAVGSPLQGHTKAVYSVTFSPDGKRIVSGSGDKTIRIWDSVTGNELGSPLRGHTNNVFCVAVSADGKRIVSGSGDYSLRMWDAESGNKLGSPLQGHAGRMPSWLGGGVPSAAFSPDGTLIVSCSSDETIRVWDGMTGEALGSPVQAHDNVITSVAFSPDGNRIASGSWDHTVRVWDSTTFEALSHSKLSQFTISIDDDPSILTNVSDAVAQCKQGEMDEAMRTFDLAIALSSSTPKNIPSIFSILVIKAIALFEAGNNKTAIKRVDDLIRLGSERGNAGLQMVKAYMLNEHARKAFERGQYDGVVELLSGACSDGDLSRTMDTYYKHEAYIPPDQGLTLVRTLFGWDFKTVRYTINQTQCKALRRMGRSQDALSAVENMGKNVKDDEREQYEIWSTGFKQECTTEWSVGANRALEDGHYDSAIEQYSGSIALDPSNYDLYLNRSSAYASKQLWSEALEDAEQAIRLDPSRAPAHQQKYIALRGARRYDEAIEVLKVVVGKSGTTSNDQNASSGDIEAKIRILASKAIKNMPTRLFDTTSGVLCEKGDILRRFKASDPYKKLVSSIITRKELDRGESTTNLVNSYFRYAMLSHRWEDDEILLQDIGEGESIHEMKSNSPGLVKLQKLCTIALGLGFLWAWSDTCCIDKKDAVELQRSIASMYQWYSNSPVTIIYLSDVVDSSSAQFTNSKWFTRGWTLQELLAPPRILFYRRDWSLFWDEEAGDEDGGAVLHDNVPLINHKGCDEILYMIEQATEIDVEILRDFQPGMHDTRQKLRWASRRQTTEVEDAAYSLFGMFDIQLPVIYGEKEKALGRLLQEIVGQTGELAVLDWVGERGKMHSCLPLDISSFRLTQWVPPLLDNTEITAQISSLRNALLPQDIDKLAGVRRRLQNLPVPRFLQNRLSLPCILYPVKAVTQQSQTGLVRQFAINATGLKGFNIRTTEMMHEGSEARPSHQKYIVAHIMRDDLLELLMEVPDDEATGVFEMIVALSRPFLPFLLLQRGKVYERIASLDDITTEVEDMMAVCADGLNVTTLEVI